MAACAVVCVVCGAAAPLQASSNPPSAAQTVRRIRKAAIQGDAHAQNNLGFMYANGKGVPQDYGKALKWYRKAAEQGDAGAQYELGRMYGAGRGVPQDTVQAAKWWILANAGGNKPAGQIPPAIEALMSPSQVAETQRLAQQWWSQHHSH